MRLNLNLPGGPLTSPGNNSITNNDKQEQGDNQVETYQLKE